MTISDREDVRGQRVVGVQCLINIQKFNIAFTNTLKFVGLLVKLPVVEVQGAAFGG